VYKLIMKAGSGTAWNLHEEVLAEYRLPYRVSITDGTIREGEEAPHVVYRLEEKLRITRLLNGMRVHDTASVD